MKSLLILIFCCYLADTRTLWEPSLPEITINQTLNQDKIQIANLKDTLSSNSLSHFHNVTELRIVKNRLEKIEPGALCASPNLKILELDFSGNRNAPKLTQNMFGNCNLEELFLKFDYNEPSSMENNALETLSTVKNLGIDCLQIPVLKKDFKLPTALTGLILSQNSLTEIQPNVFDNLQNLESLEISHNPQLTSLPQACFKNLKKLKELKLTDNALDLTWDEFEGLEALQYLSLSDNLIKNLDVKKVAKNLPNLKELSLEVNPADCQKYQAALNVKLWAKINCT